MRIISQNIKSGTIKVAGNAIAQTGQGIALFIGFKQGDNRDTLMKMAQKVVTMRVLPDAMGRTNEAIDIQEGSLLLIPNFTLYASLKGMRRPSLSQAMNQAEAAIFFNDFVTIVKQLYPRVQSGQFGADMEITLINDGPFTLIIDSDELFSQPS
jgi:D-tyrosyl-tRNA(Tyr) deacylase